MTNKASFLKNKGINIFSRPMNKVLEHHFSRALFANDCMVNSKKFKNFHFKPGLSKLRFGLSAKMSENYFAKMKKCQKISWPSCEKV